MSKISLVYIIAICLLIGGCKSKRSKNHNAADADSSYTFSGKVTGINSGWIYLKHRESADLKTDSAIIKNGAFSFSGRVAEPEFCNIGFKYNGKKDFYFGFFLQNGNIFLKCNKDSLNDAAVVFTGSPVQHEFKHFQQLAKPIDSMDYRLQLAYDKANASHDKNQINAVNRQFEALEKQRKQLVKNYAASHPSSYVTVFELYSDFSVEKDAVQLKEMYSRLDAKIRASYFGEKIRRNLSH